VLTAGRYWTTAGPLVTTRSALVGLTGFVEPGLAEALADERDRLFDHAGVDEPDPGEVDEQAVVLIVDGDPHPAVARTEGGLWAARTELDATGDGRRLLVTVVSRGVALDELTLAAVADLRPYLRGRWRMGARLAVGVLRQLPRRPRAADASSGAPHLELVEHCVAESERLRTALAAGRTPGSPRESGSIHAARWGAAVRAQMEARHQSRPIADDAVTVMVNHMTQLAQSAGWFYDQPALRRAAVDETIRFTAHGEPVASLSAQHAWLDSWSARRSAADFLTSDVERPDVGRVERVQSRIAAHRDMEQQWLDAWSRWVEQQTRDTPS